MSFVRYKIGDIEQIIQFDEGIEQQLKDDLSFKFSLPLEEGQPPKLPAVTISNNLPNSFQRWKKYRHILLNNVKIYSKDDDKLYFYIVYDHFENYIFSIVFNCLMLTLCTSYDILRVHGMLLNNGDIIFGCCNIGKTTLAYRINNNNQNLKCLCDDDLLIDLKNNTVYPLPYFWWEGSGLFINNPIIFKSYKMGRMMYLSKDKEEEIREISKNDFDQQLYNSLIMFLFHPFATREQNLRCPVMYRWIIFKYGLQEMIEKRIKELRDKYLSNLKPLCMYTNTKDLNKPFNVIEDV